MAVVPLRRNREFVALWVGQAVSNLGIGISAFAYPLVVLQETESPTKAGLVGSVLAGTAFFLRLPAGVLVDRWNRRTILIACDAGRALNAAAFAAVLVSGHFFFAHVLVVAFVEAALGVMFGPAEAAAVRRVVAPEQVRDAVAQNQTRTALPGLLGPLLGGVLLTADRALPFAADAATYLVSLACVLLVRTPLRESEPPPARPHPVTGVLEGLRWVWGHPFLRTLLLWSVGISMVFNALGLLTLVAARERGASPAQLGLMFAIVSSGAVIGALAAPRLLRRLQPRTLIVAFAWMATVAASLLAIVHSPYGIGALGAVAVLLLPPVNALAFAFIAEEAPDAMQGRATSAGIQLAGFGGPVGPVVAGALLAALDVTAALLVYAGALLALALIATGSSALRLHRRPLAPGGG